MRPNQAQNTIKLTSGQVLTMTIPPSPRGSYLSVPHGSSRLCFSSPSTRAQERHSLSRAHSQSVPAWSRPAEPSVQLAGRGRSLVDLLTGTGMASPPATIWPLRQACDC